MPIKNILIVDDSATDRQFLSELLMKNGYKVSTADSAEDALAKVKQHRPDLVLMAAKASLRDYQRELSARLQSAELGSTASKLALQVGDEGWLVDLADAGEVIPVTPISAVPLTRAWFKGVTNIRGNLYSVVDFSAFLGGPRVTVREQARLLLVGERFRVGSALLVA